MMYRKHAFTFFPKYDVFSDSRLALNITVVYEKQAQHPCVIICYSKPMEFLEDVQTDK